MGAYLSEPMTVKESEDGDGNKLKYGACSMQGWRVSQEDAHNCVSKFDEKSSLFGVYDGHGGAEVAIYISRHFPDLLKTLEAYKKGDINGALIQAFLQMDASIKTPDVLAEIQRIAKADGETEYEGTADFEEENVGQLYEEATMPPEKLVAKYSYKGQASEADSKNDTSASGSDRPCSSKIFFKSSGIHMIKDEVNTSGNSNKTENVTSSAGSSKATNSAEAVPKTEPEEASSSVIGAKVAKEASSVTEPKEASSSVIVPKEAEDTSSKVDPKEASSKTDSELPSSSKALPDEASSTTSDTANAGSSSNNSHDSSKNIIKVKPADCDSTTQSTVSLLSESANKESGNSATGSVSNSSEASGISSSSQKHESQEAPCGSAEKSTSSPAAVINGDGNVTVDKLSKPLTNGDNEAQASSGMKSDTEGKPVVESPKPRKGKSHPVPVIVTQASPSKKPERVSPRKSARNLGSMPFPESDSEFDSSDSGNQSPTPGYAMEDSDDDDDEDMEQGNSSSSDESDDGEDEYESDDEDEDDTFLNGIQEPGFDSGSTAVVAFLRWESEKLNLWVANAGDSRCVVSRSGVALEMSYDHKPESEEEALRIVKAGGKVTEEGRVNGGLNLSRAIGDHTYKQNTTLPPEEQMISPLPTIEHVELDPEEDEFVVLACDGVWNSMSSQQVVDFVAQRIKTASSLSKICEELFDACLAHNTHGDGTGCDNMTAVIVQLPKSSNPTGVKRSIEDEEDADTALQPEQHKKSKLDTEQK